MLYCQICIKDTSERSETEAGDEKTTGEKMLSSLTKGKSGCCRDILFTEESLLQGSATGRI